MPNFKQMIDQMKQKEVAEEQPKVHPSVARRNADTEAFERGMKDLGGKWDRGEIKDEEWETLAGKQRADYEAKQKDWDYFDIEEGFKPTEKVEDFNDYYGAKTHSERNFNLYAGNDQGIYDYILKNKKALIDLAEKDPVKAFNEISRHAWYPDKSVTPNNIRKSYLLNVIKGLGEE